MHNGTPSSNGKREQAQAGPEDTEKFRELSGPKAHESFFCSVAFFHRQRIWSPGLFPMTRRMRKKTFMSDLQMVLLCTLSPPE